MTPLRPRRGDSPRPNPGDEAINDDYECDYDDDGGDDDGDDDGDDAAVYTNECVEIIPLFLFVI